MTYGKDVRFEYFRVKGTCNRKKGRPRMKHLEPYLSQYPWAEPPSPRGGAVVCTLFKDGKAFASGVSICSMSDNFNYKIGREIAYGRALAEANRKLQEGKESGQESIGKVAYQGVNMAQLPEGRYELDGYVIRLEQRPGGYTLHPEVRS